jgi:hypothetical protein
VTMLPGMSLHPFIAPSSCELLFVDVCNVKMQKISHSRSFCWS